jgi:TRAP-type C4-dicarboxylate transport system substrate-binding protein
MKQIGRLTVLFLGLALLVATCQGTKRTLRIRLSSWRYASQNPPNHPYSIADQNWIAKIEKETNGRVKIKPYWGGTTHLITRSI